MNPKYGYISVHPCQDAANAFNGNLVRDHVKTPMDSLEQVADVMLTRSWSTAIWKDGHAKNVNFICGHGIPLDVDNGLPICEAMKVLDGFSHVICTTKSHQKWKGGEPPRDRYRIYIPTVRSIETDAEWRATSGYWVDLLKADRSSIAPAHHYKPGIALYSIDSSGNRAAVELPKPRPTWDTTTATTNISSGMLETMAHNFMASYKKHGGRNRAAYIASHRLKEAGRSKSWAIGFITLRTDLDKQEIEQIARSVWGV